MTDYANSPFSDMLRAGICLARRGIIALSLPVAKSVLDHAIAKIELRRVGAPKLPLNRMVKGN